MIKKVLKVLYISFGLLIGLLVCLVGYQTNGATHVMNMVNEALDSKNYSELVMIHGVCFDKESIVEDDSDKLDIVIFPGTHLTMAQYYENGDEENDDKTVVKKYLAEKAYYIYIISPKFSIKGYSENKEFVNHSGLKFVSNNSSYKYNFLVSDTVNDECLEKTPVCFEDSYFGYRDDINYNSVWGYMNIVITEGMLKAMNVSNTNKIEIYDDTDTIAASFDVNLDFSQKFFTDVDPFVSTHNDYLKKIDGHENDRSLVKEADAEFEKFYLGEAKDGSSGFKNDFVKLDDSYSFRYDDKILAPGKLVWQTIGGLAIYLLAAVVLYLLFFHFKDLMNIFTKNKGNYRVNPASVNAAKQANNNIINAKVKEEKPSKTEVVSDNNKAPEEVKSDVIEGVEESKQEVSQETEEAIDATSDDNKNNE